MLSLKNTFTKAIFVFVTIYNFAYASDPKFYLGLDASRQDLNLDLDLDTDAVYLDSGIEAKDYYKNNSINPSIFAGVDVLDFLKIEASYTQSSTTKKNNQNLEFLWHLSAKSIYLFGCLCYHICNIHWLG